MLLPEHPQNPGPFAAQHGYADIKFKTAKYRDEPTPLAGQQGKAQQFISSQTDKEHQKKYGKKLLNILVRAVCN